MAPKFDWSSLKADFLADPDCLTVADFLRKLAIKMNGNVSKQTAGWTEEKQRVRNEALERAKKKIVKSEAEKIVSMHKRQARLGADIIKQLQKMVKSGKQQEWFNVNGVGPIKIVRKVNIKDLASAATGLKGAQAAERLAYGLTESDSGAGKDHGPGAGPAAESDASRSLLERIEKLIPAGPDPADPSKMPV